jgi:hypothetical protein
MTNLKTPASPAARTALRAGVFAAVSLVILGYVGIALAIATYFYPPLFLLGLGLLNRKPMCANIEVLRGAETHRLGEEYRLKLEGSSRLIQKDPAGYNLWETPRGRWWIPAGSDKFLPALLAQQQSKIYGSASSGVHSGDIVLAGTSRYDSEARPSWTGFLRVPLLCHDLFPNARSQPDALFLFTAGLDDSG